MFRRGLGGFRRPEWFERYDRSEEVGSPDGFAQPGASGEAADADGVPFDGQNMPEGAPEEFMSWRPRGGRGPWSDEPSFGPPWARGFGGPPWARRGPWGDPSQGGPRRPFGPPWARSEYGEQGEYGGYGQFGGPHGRHGHGGHHEHGHHEHGHHEHGRHGRHGWRGDESSEWSGGPFGMPGPFGRFGRGRSFGPPWARGGRWGWFPGPRGFGGGGWPGPEGWGPFMGRRFGFGGPGPRMFERGHLKYALLELLQERPKHGYEMMKELEERMGGFYAPSAGAIYPTLQLLEDRGWVSVETVEGKKIYTITDAGRQAVSENAQRAEQRAQGPQGQHGPHGHGPHGGPEGPHGPWNWGEQRGGPEAGPGFGPGFGRGFGPGFGRGFGGAWRGQPEAQALAREARDVGRLMLMAGMQSIGQPERLTQLKGIVERARGELEAFLNQAPSSQGSQGSQPAQDAPQGPTEQVSDQGGPVETV